MPSRIAAVCATVVLGVALAAAPVALGDQPTDVIDCYAEVGDPAPGTPAWDLADLNNRWCGSAHPRTSATNPAYLAAVASNVAQGSAHAGDPFRAPMRWGGVRGNLEHVTWTDRTGADHAGTLYGPLDAGGGPYPGVVVPCHVCFVPVAADGYLWGLQALAEAGYVVFFPEIGTAEDTVDATDWFLSDSNPWHGRLDSDRLGIAGHSGAAVVALTVGNTDPRFDAAIGWDRARSADGMFDPGQDHYVAPTKPTMLQLADYHQAQSGVTAYEPHHTKPAPDPGTKFTDFDAFRAKGIDTMQVVPRASTHAEWSGASSAVQPLGGSLYGESVVTYYTLAWFDRYVRGESEPAVATQALDRLTTTSTFDTFADEHLIGAGFFDARKAQHAGNVEAGNVPIRVGGLQVRNLLSWLYPSRYFFDVDGRGLDCGDMRAGCPS